MRVLNRAAALAVGAALAAAMWSCGSAAAPGPAPPAPVTSRAFLHVLDLKGDVFHTYEVVAETGRLRSTSTTPAEGASAAGADPHDRMLLVWVLGKGTDKIPSSSNILRSYTVDPGNGTLVPAAEQRTSERPVGVHEWYPAALTLSRDRVFLWGSYMGVGYDDYGYLHGYERRTDGAWVDATQPQVVFGEDYLDAVYASPAASRVYLISGSSYFGSRLAANVPGADGSYNQQGPAMDLSQPAQTGFDAAFDVTAGAVVGEHLVLAGVHAPNGLRMTQLATFRVDDATGQLRGETLYPDDIVDRGTRLIGASNDQLAEIGNSGVHLFRLDASGALTLTGKIQDAVTGGAAFHPSGEFLYFCSGGGLWTYRLSGGSWSPFAFDPGVPPGQIVLTAG